MDVAREPRKYPKLGKIGDSLLLSHFLIFFIILKFQNFTSNVALLLAISLSFRSLAVFLLGGKFLPPGHKSLWFFWIFSVCIFSVKFGRLGWNFGKFQQKFWNHKKRPLISTSWTLVNKVLTKHVLKLEGV